MNNFFGSMLNDSNGCGGANETNDQENETLSIGFCDHLKFVALKAKGFKFRLSIRDDNATNDVVWMRATIRSNIENFGHYVCLDVIKRKLSTLN